MLGTPRNGWPGDPVGKDMKEPYPWLGVGLFCVDNRYFQTYQAVMASEVEPPFVSATKKTKGGSAPRQNSFLFIPQALGAPVAMTYCWDFGYTSKGNALIFRPESQTAYSVEYAA